MTPTRYKINTTVAEHLREALSWCFEIGHRIEIYNKIRDAECHDDMVQQVRNTLNILMSSCPTSGD